MKVPYLLKVILSAVVALSSALAIAVDEKAAPFIVQSHRGAGVLAPENTIEAFELGWKLGTIPEADLRTTKDGVLVAFHDATFARVVKDASPELKKQGVKDLTFAELSKLEVGAEMEGGGEFKTRKVSTMAEIFEVMRPHPGKQMYLDIKQVDLKQLADLVKQHNVGPQVILASADLKIIREWKSLLPGSHTLLWMGGSEEKLRGRFKELRESGFAGVTQLQVHVKNAGSETEMIPSSAFLKEIGPELKGRNILYQVLPWGSNDAAHYRKLLDLGVQSFATDHPEVVVKLRGAQ